MNTCLCKIHQKIFDMHKISSHLWWMHVPHVGFHLVDCEVGDGSVYGVCFQFSLLISIPTEKKHG